ncbi:hypothetical protein Hanom_Chr04g00331791 [Helianthus anomalus]
MYQECARWEKYRERLSAEVKEFEKMKSNFQEEKVAFDKEKMSEEWGREGLWSKLQASEDLLAKERREWHVACENENKIMFAACTKITNLEAEVASLKDKYEEAKSHRERAEDAEIAKLKRRLLEAQEKNESLEIDLVAEKVKADTAEEVRKEAEQARKISISALNDAQTNYAATQTIVDTVLSDSKWMREHGVAVVANSILKAIELHKPVVALTNDVHAVVHRGGYLECTQHVEEELRQHFGTRHCTLTDQAEKMLAKAEEVYDNLSLSVMELVLDALKHDNYVARLKSIFMVPENVELSDEEEIAGGDGEELVVGCLMFYAVMPCIIF